MDNSKHMKDSAHLLDDLESIRQLLGDDPAQPPLLTESVHSDEQVPLLFDVVTGQVVTLDEHEADIDNIPLLTPEPVAATPPAPAANASSASSAKAPNAEALLHLDAELRAAAQLIMQDVIDDFAPHIENEIKRRLDARMERLLSQYNN